MRMTSANASGARFPHQASMNASKNARTKDNSAGVIPGPFKAAMGLDAAESRWLIVGLGAVPRTRVRLHGSRRVHRRVRQQQLLDLYDGAKIQ